MENFQFTSFEEFKRHLGVEQIEFLPCKSGRKMGLVYGLKIFTAEKFTWEKDVYVTEGEHGNLYLCNLKSDVKREAH